MCHPVRQGEPAATLCAQLRTLLAAGVAVALCTAVGDPRPEPFEDRLSGLLKVRALTSCLPFFLTVLQLKTIQFINRFIQFRSHFG